MVDAGLVGVGEGLAAALVHALCCHVSWGFVRRWFCQVCTDEKVVVGGGAFADGWTVRSALGCGARWTSFTSCAHELLGST